MADRCDVYVGAGLYRHPRRGSAKDVSAMVGLWADIDLADVVHKKANLPRDEADAKKILLRLRHWPSIIVHSGHGLQCWWLFEEPLGIEAEADRRFAMALAKGWTDCVRKQARAAGGWDVDATGDLARVLRLPGTVNRKSSPAIRVRVLEPEALNGNVVRYDVEDFREFAGVAQKQPEIQGEMAPLRLDPDATPPASKFACLLANDEKFRRTWERNRPDLQDQSPSAFDMSLASIAAADGWEDQEITDLLIAARRMHRDELKLRRDYYRRTIARARSGLSDSRPGSDEGADGNVAKTGVCEGRRASSRSGGDKSMNYKKALDMGHERANQAAEAIRRWTGVKAYAVCAVQPGRGNRDWKPVGQHGWKEIAKDDGFYGDSKYHVLVVDETGTVKACTKKRFPLGEALRLADRLPLPVAKSGDLSKQLEELELRTNARDHALRVEV